MKIKGIILAGGKSTRMNQDKALLKIGDTNLLRRQFLQLEKHLGTGNVLVSGNRQDYPHILDCRKDLGPVEGLRSVCIHLLKNSMDVPLLIVPVDMPFLCDQNVHQLIHYKTTNDAVKFINYQLPIKFKSSRIVLDQINLLKIKFKMNQSQYFSFKQLYKLLQIEEIRAEEDRCFLNLNTPEDWNAAIS